VFHIPYVKDIVYREKVENANESPADKIVRAADSVSNEMMTSTSNKLIILVRVAPLTLPMLRPTEHIIFV
jgi:hypothetical protein